MKKKIVGISVCMLMIATAALPVVANMNDDKTIGDLSTSSYNEIIGTTTYTFNNQTYTGTMHGYGFDTGEVKVNINITLITDILKWLLDHHWPWPPHPSMWCVVGPILVPGGSGLKDLLDLSNGTLNCSQHMEDYYNSTLVGEVYETYDIWPIDSNTFSAQADVTIWYTGPDINLSEAPDNCCRVLLEQVGPGSVKATYNYSALLTDGLTFETKVTRYYNYTTTEELPCTEILNFTFTKIEGTSNSFDYDANGVFEPAITIDEIKSGLGVTTVITNHAPVAIDTTVAIDVTGGILGFINVSKTNTLSISPGASASLNTDIFLGLGPIAIAVIADGRTESRNGIQLIIFTLVS